MNPASKSLLRMSTRLAPAVHRGVSHASERLILRHSDTGDKRYDGGLIGLVLTCFGIPGSAPAGSWHEIGTCHGKRRGHVNRQAHSSIYTLAGHLGQRHIASSSVRFRPEQHRRRVSWAHYRNKTCDGEDCFCTKYGLITNHERAHRSGERTEGDDCIEFAQLADN